MARRQLAYATGSEPTMHESGQEFMEGVWESVTVERSAAGVPQLLFIMERHDGDIMWDQMVVTVKDGAEFLRPVSEWLLGGSLESIVRDAVKRALRSEVEVSRVGERRAEFFYRTHADGNRAVDEISNSVIAALRGQA